jgi:hypothetical protein
VVRIVIQRSPQPGAVDPADYAREQGGAPAQSYFAPGTQAYTQTPTLPLRGDVQYRPRPRRHWPPRPRIPRWAKWTAVLILFGVIFRRAVAWAVLTALSAALHLVGLNVNFPHIRFGWPWQSITAGSTTNTLVGPLVLQKIEGISRPALGTENFSFVFTHKVSKDIGLWPCWYSATFAASGKASATVNLNPGPAWWKPSTGHYRLQVLRAPSSGHPGRLAVSMALPLPQLPQSVHDVAVDDTLSKPLSSDHSWTYPGLGCGVLIQPQFTQSVLYAQAQSTAFYQATHLASVTRPLIGAAEAEATAMIRDNFIQPTLNSLGYTLSSFTVRWVNP